jgi:hypothetical protein
MTGEYYRVVVDKPDRGCVVVTVVPGKQVLEAAVIQFEYGRDPRYRNDFAPQDPNRYFSRLVFGSVIHRQQVYVRGEAMVKSIRDLMNKSMEKYGDGEHPNAADQPASDYAWFFEWATSDSGSRFSESIVGRCHPAAGGIGEYMLALAGVDYESILRRWSLPADAEPCRGEDLPIANW